MKNKILITSGIVIVVSIFIWKLFAIQPDAKNFSSKPFTAKEIISLRGQCLTIYDIPYSNPLFFDPEGFQIWTPDGDTLFDIKNTVFELDGKKFNEVELEQYLRKIKPGDYDIYVSAEGYKVSGFNLTDYTKWKMKLIITDALLTENFSTAVFDPIHKITELENNYMQRYLTPDNALVLGFIRDEFHNPLSGVKITVPNSTISTESDGNGFFQLTFDMSSTDSSNQSLLLSKQGYQNMTYDLLSLTKGKSTTVNIRMIPGNGYLYVQNYNPLHECNYSD